MKEWIVKTVLVAVALLTPIKSMLIATGLLIFADLILGVWAAHKRNEAITSAGLRRSVTKFLVYQLVIITGFVVEKWLLDDLLPVSKLVSGVIGLVELKSLLENANTIHGSDLFKTVINKLGSDNHKD